jgi:hypothetical protein
MKNKIDPEALYWVTFNHCEFRIPGQAVIDICKPGDNDDAVTLWLPKIERNCGGNAPTSEAVLRELIDSGGWTDSELEDNEQNWKRLVWMGAWNIFEDDEPDSSEPALPLVEEDEVGELKPLTEDQKYIVEMARERLQDRNVDDIIEIDPIPKIAENDEINNNGAYVQAWIWVPFCDTRLDKEKYEEG